MKAWFGQALVAYLTSVIGVYLAISICSLTGVWGNMFHMVAQNMVAALLYAWPNMLPTSDKARVFCLVTCNLFVYLVGNIWFVSVLTKSDLLTQVMEWRTALFAFVILMANLFAYPILLRLAKPKEILA